MSANAQHTEQKRQHAEEMASRWLGDANEAEERGAVKTAAKYLAKAQYWLGRLNDLEGLNVNALAE